MIQKDVERAVAARNLISAIETKTQELEQSMLSGRKATHTWVVSTMLTVLTFLVVLIEESSLWRRPLGLLLTICIGVFSLAALPFCRLIAAKNFLFSAWRCDCRPRAGKA
jgi:Na+-translocating ferredoxin:NAD+ oxidoreductase RnfD subunit